jgi:geranylgeranyl pyrophosphate synthase
VTALSTMSAVEGLAGYLEEVEERLAGVVEAHPGTVAAVGSDALAAGGKRMRPALTFLSSRPGATPPVTEGTAIELVHMASLVHDDIVDEARLRRGRAAAWTAHGPFAAKATGDHLFARAFVTLAATDPETSIEAYVERCALKTGSLFAAACVLGGGSAEFGRLLGIAFQIVDDVLDCSGETIETGKVAGTDLRDGTPTLPLLLAAREDVVVRRALEGGSLEGALVRVAASGALERSRETALDYARRARASLNGAVRREELEALVDAVVDRDR